MNNIDTALLDTLVDEIYKKIEQKFTKQLNTANVEYAFNGIVTEYDATTDCAAVDIGTSTTPLLPNKTGFETLAVGDAVKVFSDRTNMVGAYIGVKLS